MSFDKVITLVATPPHPAIEGKRIQQLVAALEGAGATLAQPVWLAEGIAVDLAFTGIEDNLVQALAEAVLEGAAVDAVIQKTAKRRKKLMLADMDSTIVQQESLDELADCVGLKAEIAAITEQAMRGELDFAAALRARVKMLKGLDVAALDKTLARLTYMPGAEVFIRTLRAHNVQCHLVSSGFRFFTGAIAKRLGFNGHQGNELVIVEEKLTGAVHEPILDKNSKLETLYKLAADNKLSLDETMAVGDGANDIPMLQNAGLGIALHAKPKVNEQVNARIRHSDLTALLYVQGYTQDELAA